jgi:hypothetical protein
MRIKVSSEQIWMAKVYSPKSIAEDAFWIPLVILPLMGGGGGGLELDAQLSNGRD